MVDEVACFHVNAVWAIIQVLYVQMVTERGFAVRRCALSPLHSEVIHLFSVNAAGSWGTGCRGCWRPLRVDVLVCWFSECFVTSMFLQVICPICAGLSPVLGGGLSVLSLEWDYEQHQVIRGGDPYS